MSSRTAVSKPYILYAWPLSLYSGKVRAYLRYKGISFVEKPIRAWTFRTIERKTGANVMPVLVTPEGEWLQDSSAIMDRLEQRFPQAPVLPATPRQRVAAYVLEAWGDEYWLPAAMHYRWNFRENFERLFRQEAGDLLAPLAPRFVKDRLADGIAAKLRGFLPGLGVVSAQINTIEAWTEGMLDRFDAHFEQQPYLLGTRPSYGDFGLVGPLFAHLGRDPYPRRTLIEPRRHLAAWVARMQQPEQPRGGEFLSGDRIPPTLAPVFEAIFTEFWPSLAAIQDEVRRALPTLRNGRGFRRSLGEIEFPMGARRYRRLATPYSLWMAQRALDAYRGLAPAQQLSVDAWLATVSGAKAMQLAIEPRLTRMALRVAPEASSYPLPLAGEGGAQGRERA
jgi:glutathione S-transferase